MSSDCCKMIEKSCKNHTYRAVFSDKTIDLGRGRHFRCTAVHQRKGKDLEKAGVANSPVTVSSLPTGIVVILMVK